MYAVLSRRGLRIISLLLLLFAAFILEGILITKADNRDIRNPEQRIAYLEEIGVTVDPESLCETEVTIPKTFGDVYNNYNALQSQAGFDLEDYKGISVTKYTYKALDRGDNVYVNMLCYKGRVIGGDISSAELGGFMLPLCKEK